MNKPIVYIMSPYTKGDVAVNVHNALMAADELAKRGFIPYVPVWTHFWHMVSPHPYEFWMEIDEAILLRCDAAYRVPGESSGADHEMKIATDKWIPVFTDMDSLVAWFKEITGASALDNGSNKKAH